MRDTAVEAIRKALMDGRFVPGEALSEATLASEMAISRGPVREALLVLAQQGLVTHSHNYGFSVARFTEQDRLEVLQVRLPLETLALEPARARVTGEDLAILDQFKEKLVCAYVAGVRQNRRHTDFQFHSAHLGAEQQQPPGPEPVQPVNPILCLRLGISDWTSGSVPGSCWSVSMRLISISCAARRNARRRSA